MHWLESLGAALALALVIEGLLPFFSPGAWRRVFEQLLALSDGQIRGWGLASMLAGVVLLWTVLGPTIEVPEEALAGTYGGLTAGVSLGVGGNANALVGGFGRSIFPQPLSVEGQTGINLSAGVAGLTLEPS